MSKIIQSGRGKKYHKIFLDKNLGLHYTILKKSGWSSLKNMAIQEILVTKQYFLSFTIIPLNIEYFYDIYKKMVYLIKTNTSTKRSWLTSSAAEENQLNNALSNGTFIGIDFGTSTTVVSYMTNPGKSPDIHVQTFALKQPTEFGGTTSNELVNSVVAWYNNKLLFGRDAYNLRYKLNEGVNVFSSFKMLLGVDIGPTYPQTLLSKNQKKEYVIETASDAATIFFEKLLESIKTAVYELNLPKNLFYSISVPASF
ncbi:MAG: hypothetical protein LBE27_02455, partial [Deltaproteobacteria bacterium]|nr:hypothetical protein [Deltaproteobacteria bacterium]